MPEPLDPAKVMAEDQPTPVHQYDDSNGVFVYGDDGELVTMHQLCQACTWDNTLELLGDCEWTEDSEGSIYWPCEPYRLAEALADAQRREHEALEAIGRGATEAANEVATLREQVQRVLSPATEPLRDTAYYYSFELTGVGIIDRILSAVATAGKRSHHTEDWADNGLADQIQQAAHQAAEALTALDDDQPKPDYGDPEWRSLFEGSWTPPDQPKPEADRTRHVCIGRDCESVECDR